eukprot:2275377-Prymnesium_polylepis.1
MRGIETQMRGIETQTTDLYLAFCGNLPREVCKMVPQTVRAHHQKGLVVKDINFLGEHMMTHDVRRITEYLDHNWASLYNDRALEAQMEGDKRTAAYWDSLNVPYHELFVLYPVPLTTKLALERRLFSRILA